MKTRTASYSFSDILRHLAKQDPEEKLRIGFQLNEFVRKLRAAGEVYERTNTKQSSRTTA